MSVKPFEPEFMPIGVLTAALQELTPREKRDPDPDLAVEEWLDFARELGADSIQLSAALHPDESDIPAEAMLDPVANTLDLRAPFSAERAARVAAAVKDTGVEIADLAYFDNMLHEDAATRAKKHAFMLRVFDAAVALGVPAVCGFVGRNNALSMDQNLEDFEASFVPLLQEAKARGLEYRIEQCPMPGWTVGDAFHNNIAYTPGTWIALHRICERHGVGDQLRIHYDPSHAILMGQDTRSRSSSTCATRAIPFLDLRLPREGPGHRLRRASRGLGLRRPDPRAGRLGRTAALSPRTRRTSANAWKKQTDLRRARASRHRAPRPARLSPRTAASTGSTTSSPPASCSRSTSTNTPLIVEHEYPPARVQEQATTLASRSCSGSIAFTRAHRSRRRLACTRCRTRSCPPRAFAVQGVGREAYRS